jgi:ferredoxin-type protein NapF
MQRRDFFKSLKKTFKKNEENRPLIIRPPYFQDEILFEQECINCDGKCADACEENIIFMENKTPIIKFDARGCTYCDECAKVCERGVLKTEYKKNINVIIEIEVHKCLSWSKTMCFACKDPCLENAIDFAGIYFPEINQDKCTSCGFCIGVCPTNAIKLRSKEDEQDI